MSENANNFLFGGTVENDDSLSVFDKSETSSDGIYRPTLKDATDKKHGYHAVIRFLPNVLENGLKGPSAIKKHVHYVDMKNNPNLAGYYDCNKNFEKDCPLCTEYWRLFNSKNTIDNENAKQLTKINKWYSYVMIIEDQQHPELVGKIMVFSYGAQIKNKIVSEKNGELTGKSCDVFDVIKGKDFKLIIKEKGGYTNYETSSFLEICPIKIYSEKKKEFKVVPVMESGLIGIDGNATQTTKIRNKVVSIMTDIEIKLTDFSPVKWDDEKIGKVNDILAIMSGNIQYKADQQSKNTVSDSTTNKKVDDFDTTPQDDDQFFDSDDMEWDD
jgi:hypothetical protein